MFVEGDFCLLLSTKVTYFPTVSVQKLNLQVQRGNLKTKSKYLQIFCIQKFYVYECYFQDFEIQRQKFAPDKKWSFSMFVHCINKAVINSFLKKRGKLISNNQLGC